MTAGSTVAVCVVTYLRPRGLERLLARLATLDPAGTTVRLVVVDNDPAGSALPIVERMASALPFDVDALVEPRRGITFARNSALDAARRSGADWIVWFDDDEAPRAEWLRLVIETQRSTGADVVLGPSEPIYEPGGSTTAIATRAFESERFTTGAEYPFFHTRTSGVIVRAGIVPDEGFDDRLALTGGEDRLFFTRIHRAGGRFVWDDRAVVDEWVPASRQQARWLIRRWFRTGVTRSLTLLILDDPSLPRRARRVAGGLAMALHGTWKTIVAAPRGRAATLAAGRRVLLGLGASTGALGIHYREYRRIHGA